MSTRPDRKQSSTEAKQNSSNHPGNESFLNFNDSNGPRIGKLFQAAIPQEGVEFSDEKSVLLWKPPSDLNDEELNDFLAEAQIKYGYSLEQAFGLLQWNKYNYDKSRKDIRYYQPCQDKWSQADCLLFEQAFQFNGKCFHRIQQMLPDKSLKELVKYYYGWKKSKRLREHYLDHCNKKYLESDEDEMEEANKKFASNKRSSCSNCQSTAAQLYQGPQGKLCNTCFLHFRRKGQIRQIVKKTDEIEDVEPKRTHRIPRNYNLNLKEFGDLVTANYANKNECDDGVGPSSESQEISSKMKLDGQIKHLRARAFTNRVSLRTMKSDMEDPIGPFRLQPKIKYKKTSNKWSQHEIMLAVQCFRVFGKKFEDISELIGSKTADHVRSFYSTNRQKLKLDLMIMEMEEQKQKEKSMEEANIIQLSDDEDEINGNVV